MLTVKSVLKRYDNKYVLTEKKNRADFFESFFSYAYGIGGIIVPLVYAILCATMPAFVSSLSFGDYVIACIVFITIMVILLYMSSLFRRVQS